MVRLAKKTTGLFGLFVFAVTALCSVPATALAFPDLSDFSLVFSDEFNGNSLDATKWNTGYLWARRT